MHEMSIAVSIVDIVIGAAQKEKAAVVEQVEIEIGELSGILPDFLNVCLDAASRDTLAEGTTFNIRMIKGEAECEKCGARFAYSSFMEPCPECGSYEVQAIRGDDMKVVSITVND